MGTNTGLINAHFADAEPTSRLTKALRKIIPTTVTCEGNCKLWRKAAPFRAVMAPMFDWAKASINKAQKKAITI